MGCSYHDDNNVISMRQMTDHGNIITFNLSQPSNINIKLLNINLYFLPLSGR